MSLAKFFIVLELHFCGRTDPDPRLGGKQPQSEEWHGGGGQNCNCEWHSQMSFHDFHVASWQKYTTNGAGSRRRRNRFPNELDVREGERDSCFAAWCPLYKAVRVCMFVPLWRPQFFTDLAHFLHARPLGQQGGHRLFKVALQGCLRAKLRSNVALTT